MTFTIQSRFVHLDNVRVELGAYQHGGNALLAVTDDGSAETLSVNLHAYGMTPPTPTHVYVKDYSEHEGLPDALEAAGVATKVEAVRFGPYGSGYLMLISDGVILDA